MVAANNKLFKKIVRKYAPGEILFREGDKWDGMYCIQKGKVGVYKKQLKPTVGEIELAVLNAGSLIGEMGIFEPAVRDASVKALEPTEAVVVNKQMLEDQLKEIPTWVWGLVKVLANRLRIANAKNLELQHRVDFPATVE